MKFGAYHEQILKGIQVVGVMAIGLGIINIVRVHGSTVLYQKSGLLNSLALLFGFFAMLLIQAIVLMESERTLQLRAQLEALQAFPKVIEDDVAKSHTAPGPRLEALDRTLQTLSATRALPAMSETTALIHSLQEHYRSGQPTTEITAKLQANLKAVSKELLSASQAKNESSRWKKLSNLMNDGFFVSLGSAMFSLLAFYIASAAYRSFRIRSWEAFVMMATAILVMLGQIPFGPQYISEDLPYLRLWLLENISTPAFRAIFFGSAIAGLSMAIRMWLSLERGPLESDEA